MSFVASERLPSSVCTKHLVLDLLNDVERKNHYLNEGSTAYKDQEHTEIVVDGKENHVIHPLDKMFLSLYENRNHELFQVAYTWLNKK